MSRKDRNRSLFVNLGPHSDMILLPTSYMAPAGYLSKVVFGNASLLINERFVKQTIRSRMHVLSPNGVQALVIPVVHDNLNRSDSKDVRICYRSSWQRQHFRSLQAAYGKSAFWGFYEDDLKSIYEVRCEHLWEFNLSTIHFMCTAMGASVDFPIFEEFGEVVNRDVDQIGNHSSPEHMGSQPEYIQVFRDRFPFIPGLSALDLIMNLGPQSLWYLKGLLDGKENP